MKKILITTTCLITALSLLASASSVLAVTATSSASPSAAVDQKAQDLLNRVATKVAQLSEKLQKSYFGKIKNLGTATFVITTTGGTKTVGTNDATSFFRVRSGATAEINFSALKIGDDIAAIGTIDPTTTDLTARQVIAKIQRSNFVGAIKTADKSGILTISLTDKTEVKVDLSDSPTLEKIASDSGKIVKAKQSEFASGSAVLVIAHSPDDKTGIYSSLKALIIGSK